jgi:oxygen-independent coproporphyrinogen III oxidase
LTSLYVHIPFCERKCLYCDFYSVENTELIEDFLAALTREISLRQAGTEDVTFETLFFGGGTPSLLTPRQLERILSCLHAAFRIAPIAEVTLETNPGTVTEEKLRAYRSLGVNRLSVGIQSFQDAELKLLGRIHDRAEAFRCLDLARRVGFDNLGLDLIYSVPGQSLARWEDNLATAARLAPQHIAAYSLIVEEQTPMARSVASGELRVNPPDLEVHMYERTMEVLGGLGYDHYEVSNYALLGFRCRHNCAYWSHEDYLGFGPSAHSFRKAGDGRSGRRWWNTSDLVAYLARLGRGVLPMGGEEQVGPREMLAERILLGLRSGGLDVTGLSADFPVDPKMRWGGLLDEMIEDGMAVFREDRLRLTPKGFLVCDEICRRLLHVADQGRSDGGAVA